MCFPLHCLAFDNLFLLFKIVKLLFIFWNICEIQHHFYLNQKQ